MQRPEHMLKARVVASKENEDTHGVVRVACTELSHMETEGYARVDGRLETCK